MDSNDFFAVVFDVLNCSYIYLKYGEFWNVENVGTHFGKYKAVLFDFLTSNGLIEPMELQDFTEVTFCEITWKGIEYLYTNSMMKKVVESLGKNIGVL